MVLNARIPAPFATLDSPSLGTVRAQEAIPTTRRRRGRITRRQAAALAAGSPRWVRIEEGLPALGVLFGADVPVVLDIGFGTGAAVEQLALREPGHGVLAVDVHTPGIGDLLHRIHTTPLPNVAVVEADVRDVVSQLPDGALAGVRTYFPDPWPKKRHLQRRLVTTGFAEEMARVVAIGGWWHLATDWPDYAVHIEDEIGACASWVGGVIERPAWRPITRYESIALEAGRAAIDLWWTRTDAGSDR